MPPKSRDNFCRERRACPSGSCESRAEPLFALLHVLWILNRIELEVRVPLPATLHQLAGGFGRRVRFLPLVAEPVAGRRQPLFERSNWNGLSCEESSRTDVTIQLASAFSFSAASTSVP